jgi:hypothetical protein
MGPSITAKLLRLRHRSDAHEVREYIKKVEKEDEK